MTRLLCDKRYGVYLIDCQIKGDRILAGWVYCDVNLPASVTLEDEFGMSYAVSIPNEAQGLKHPFTNFFAEQPVEFLILND